MIGIDSVFVSSQICDINWHYCSERMELELIVNSKAENPPKNGKNEGRFISGLTFGEFKIY